MRQALVGSTRLDSLELESCTRQSWKVPGKGLACIAEEPEVEAGLRGRRGGAPGSPLQLLPSHC